MKATVLLKKQHKEVSQLFKKIEKAEKFSKKKTLFKELATLLVSHDGIEREILYPAFEQRMGMTDLLGEALVEHGQIEFALFLTDEATAKDFDFKCKVLKEIVDHHVKEEEDDFFPQFEKAFELSELKVLGDKMETTFEQKIQGNYRKPLHHNLAQVLEGVIKPTPAKKKEFVESVRFPNNGNASIPR